MDQKRGVGVALVASVVVTLAWLFLSVMAALAVTLLAGAGVVLAALRQRNQGD
ncbi:MAG: hypothetical protein U9R51_09215 [Actinomycetota bacterium]|nr:hypothetical protein [Actinomycetota bacterium]